MYYFEGFLAAFVARSAFFRSKYASRNSTKSLAVPSGTMCSSALAFAASSGEDS
jgi:hypothetical protein